MARDTMGNAPAVIWTLSHYSTCRYSLADILHVIALEYVQYNGSTKHAENLS